MLTKTRPCTPSARTSERPLSVAATNLVVQLMAGYKCPKGPDSDTSEDEADVLASIQASITRKHTGSLRSLSLT